MNLQELQQREWLTISQAAFLSGKHNNTIRAWAAKQLVISKREKRTNRILVLRTSLMDELKENGK